MKLIRSIFIAVAVATSATLPVFAETVEIRSAADWDNFAKRVNNGESTLNAILMRDVTLTSSSPRCGNSETRYYKGEFDGNGKTLTVAIKIANPSGEQPAAPFAWFAGGVYIHDLHVAGTIQTDSLFAGGILGHCVYVNQNKACLTRCRVSADITSTVNGDASAGGLVSWVGQNYPDVYLTDCVFNGSFKASNGDRSGGFIGWRNGAYACMTNSLFNPKEFTVAASNNDVWTLSRNGLGYYGYADNCYYTTIVGEVQGSDGRGKTAAELAALLGENWQVVTENNVQKAVPRMVTSKYEESSTSGGGGSSSGGGSSTPDPNSGVLAFTYQGKLRDAQGNKLSKKSHTIEFRIYDQAAGGSPYWGRKHNVTLEDEGNFAVELSDVAGDAIDGVTGTGLADMLARNASSTLYLGLAVDGGTAEISPRQKILEAPAALYAADATRAKGNMAVAEKVTVENLRVTNTASAGTFSTGAGISAGTFTSTSDTKVGGNLNVSGTISARGVVPIGGIIPWYGYENNIPKGWAVCNGNNDTPDLRSRFIVATGNGYKLKDRGGEERHQLNTNEMPSHRHSYGYRGADIDDDWKGQNNLYSVSHTVDWNSSITYNTGGSQPHENRPPYYALLYIKRIY